MRLEPLRRGTVLLAALVLHGSTAAGQSLVARKISDVADLARGRSALGRQGDYLLANDRIRVIIDDVGKRQGFAESGGNIVDAVTLESNLDLLTQLITYFDNTFPRQAIYDRIEIVKDGADAKEARIRASGSEMKDKNLRVVTEYSLRPGESHVLVETSVTNNGAAALADFELGDAVQWGYTDHFAPGFGRNLGGRTTAGVEWLGGTGDGVSYGYTVQSGSFYGPNGSNWSDTNVRKVRIAPGETADYSRCLIVGTGDLASVTEHVYRIRRQATGLLRGGVSETGTGAPVRDSSVAVRTAAKGEPFNEVRPGPDGAFSMALPPGDYVLQASAPGRSTPRPVPVTVRQGGESSVRLEIGRPGRMEITITDGDTKRRIPAKVTVLGLGDSPQPVLGPGYLASGAMNVVFSHTGTAGALVPPGSYEVVVSRGVEYSLHRERVTVEAGKTVELAAALRRVVDTRGFISGDFHLHSEYSSDSNIPLRDKVIGLVAEGVEFAVSSDHNYVADYKSAIRELGLSGEIRSSIGNEVTLSGTIHFNVFPLDLHAELPNNGALDPKNKKVQEMIDMVRGDPGDEVVQLNHPRVGEIGYFNTGKFDAATMTSPDPDFTLDFDAIEVFNGKYVREAAEMLREWFQLLNAGRRFAATGNSDSHKLVSEEAGYPRNFIRVGRDAPSEVREDEIVRAVKSNRILVTNGPFLTVRANGKHGLGDRFSSGGGPVRIAVELQSAPWVDVSQVNLVANGEVVERRLVPETNRVHKGTFEFRVQPAVDTWYVVVARGNRSLAPVVPDLPGQPVYPFAFTNPIWVDADGDGRFTPAVPTAGAEGRR